MTASTVRRPARGDCATLRSKKMKIERFGASKRRLRASLGCPRARREQSRALQAERFIELRARRASAGSQESRMTGNEPAPAVQSNARRPCAACTARLPAGQNDALRVR
ncbi:hypothetical protein C8Q80DRAFT_418093 [Daedaleopsis nitida]|nr:hypothetical protein C8Q80DRAFT_418093 [Daedaleopsis nitida]